LLGKGATVLRYVIRTLFITNVIFHIAPKTESQVRYECFLPNPFQYIIHQSLY